MFYVRTHWFFFAFAFAFVLFCFGLVLIQLQCCILEDFNSFFFFFTCPYLCTHQELVEEAVRKANIVVTATNSSEPLFDGRWLSPGTHINGIGSYTPSMAELDPKTIARARGYDDFCFSLFSFVCVLCVCVCVCVCVCGCVGVCAVCVCSETYTLLISLQNFSDCGL